MSQSMSVNHEALRDAWLPVIQDLNDALAREHLFTARWEVIETGGGCTALAGVHSPARVEILVTDWEGPFIGLPSHEDRYCVLARIVGEEGDAAYEEALLAVQPVALEDVAAAAVDQVGKIRT